MAPEVFLGGRVLRTLPAESVHCVIIGIIASERVSEANASCLIGPRA
jgi:hypothetical protein